MLLLHLNIGSGNVFSGCSEGRLNGSASDGGPTLADHGSVLLRVEAHIKLLIGI